MKPWLNKFLILAIIIACSCGGSTTTSDNNNPGNDSQESGANPVGSCATDIAPITNLNLSTSNTITETNQTEINLKINVSHDFPINAYIIKENSITPEANSTTWVPIGEAKTLDLNLDYSITPDDGQKQISLFVRDTCNRIFEAPQTVNLILDTTAPTAALTINNGDKFTLATNPTVSAHLTGEDSGTGISAYYLSENSVPPLTDSTNWMDISATPSIDLSISINLSQPLNKKKFYYLWLKDKVGNISAVNTAGIELLRFINHPVSYYGEYPSIAINPENQLYIVAHTGNAKAIWMSTVIDDQFYVVDFEDYGDQDLTDDVGTFASMKIDTANFAHIAYHDVTRNTLKYAHVDLNAPINSFLDKTIETIGPGGIGASLAVDSQNKPHISYQYVEAGKKYIGYANKQNGSWSLKPVASGALPMDISLSAIALDSNDNPYILTDENADEIRLRYLSGNTFLYDFVRYRAGYLNIIITPNDKFYFGFASYNLDEKYLSPDNTAISAVFGVLENNELTYQTTDTGHPGNGVSMALDSQENVYLLHSNYYDHHVAIDIYAKNIWQKYIIAPNTYTREIATTNFDPNIDLAIDSNDRIHLVYYNVNTHTLTYGTTADAE